MPHLLIFGYGYTARRIGRRLRDRGWVVSGTRSTSIGAEEVDAEGIRGYVFDGKERSERLGLAARSASHVLVSIPPTEGGDPVLRHYRTDLEAAVDRGWIGYLSTTGVYGDHGGAWIDESTPVSPGTLRSVRRVEAERAWSRLANETDCTLQIFRLSGIYGPERSVIDRLRSGTAQRLVRPGLVFNRIHVDDVAGAVLAGIGAPTASGVVNVSDDHPAPPGDVLVEAAALLDIEPPPALSADAADLSPKARSFYAENKRVANARLKHTLGYRLRYPTYREGLAAIVAEAGSDTDRPATG